MLPQNMLCLEGKARTSLKLRRRWSFKNKTQKCTLGIGILFFLVRNLKFLQ